MPDIINVRCCKAENENDIDIYLCHCQNKLNGNSNNVFLRFDDPAEEKQ